MTDSPGRRVALITGGRRGIGLAVAEGLAGDGFDVAITGTSAEDDVSRAALQRLTQRGGRAVYVAGRVDAVDDHARVLDLVEAALGPVDVLVSNAGIAPPQRLDLLETTPENFDTVLGVNLRGAFFLAQATARRMLKAGSKAGRALIFITSCSAEMVSLNRVDYCVSKAGLAMAVQGFAARLAADGIAVFEVRPGIIRTDMTAGVAGKYDALIEGGLVPAKRWGEGSRRRRCGPCAREGRHRLLHRDDRQRRRRTDHRPAVSSSTAAAAGRRPVDATIKSLRRRGHAT